jgi:hypothetical protein
MIAFEIEVNGKSLGRAGTDDLSVLSAIITAVGKLGAQSQGATDYENNYHAELAVGGLTARAEPAEDEHLEWIKHLLEPGDMLTIRIVESSSADAPRSAKPARTEEIYKQQFESAKKFYLENRDKFEGS